MKKNKIDKVENDKNLYNFEKEEKKKKRKNKIEKNQTSSQKEKDNEIIIGVTQYPKEKKNKETKDKELKHKQNKRKRIVTKEKNNQENLTRKKVNSKKANKKIIKVLKWTSIFAIIVVVVILALMSPMFNIDKITVEGNSKLTTDQIIRLSGIEEGVNSFKINKKESIKNIKKNGYIESVIIRREIPTGIKIIVVERTPNFIIEYGNGYVYINNQGYILENSTKKLEVPILKGISTNTENFKEANRLCDEDLKKISTVLKIISTAQLNEISELITWIDISDSGDYKIYFETENKTAYLGDCTNIETRMLYLTAMLKNESGRAGEVFVNMNLNTDNPFFREKVK